MGLMNLGWTDVVFALWSSGCLSFLPSRKSDELRADGMILALSKTPKLSCRMAFYVAWWRGVSSSFELAGEEYLTLLLWCASLIDVP